MPTQIIRKVFQRRSPGFGVIIHPDVQMNHWLTEFRGKVLSIQQIKIEFDPYDSDHEHPVLIEYLITADLSWDERAQYV